MGGRLIRNMLRDEMEDGSMFEDYFEPMQYVQSNMTLLTERAFDMQPCSGYIMIIFFASFFGQWVAWRLLLLGQLRLS